MFASCPKSYLLHITAADISGSCLRQIPGSIIMLTSTLEYLVVVPNVFQPS